MTYTKRILSALLFVLLGGCSFWKSEGGSHDLASAKNDEAPTEEPSKSRGPASSPEALALFAEYDADISTGQCADEIQRRIRLYRAERSWTKGPAALDGSSSYLSPTSIPGRWIKVRKFQSGELQFSVLKEDSMEIYNFSPTCTFTKTLRGKSFAKLAAKDEGPNFTDDDLLRLIERTTSFGVIYVWSPGMGYSFERNSDSRGAYYQEDSQGKPTSGIRNAQEAMRAVGLKMGVTMTFTVLADPFVKRARIQKAFLAGNHDLEESMLRRMTSFDLLMRSMGQHYPSLLVYGNGKIFRQMQPGLSTAGSYTKFIEDAVTALKKN